MLSVLDAHQQGLWYIEQWYNEDNQLLPLGERRMKIYLAPRFRSTLPEFLALLGKGG